MLARPSNGAASTSSIRPASALVETTGRTMAMPVPGNTPSRAGSSAARAVIRA
jgi:hypothetical protein